MRALDAEVVEQVEHVAADVVDRVRPGRRVASRRGRACRSGRARKRSASALACGSHIASVVPSELERTSAGASSGPVTRWWGIIGAPARGRRARGGGAGVGAVAEVRAHPLGVDLEAFERLAQPARRPSRSAISSSVQRAPLGVPRAGGALVLLHHRGQQRRDEARAPAARSRARRSRRPGCACAASRRAAAARASRTSPTSVWASSDDVARGLADRARGDAERAGELADAAAQRVPGQHRRVEAELARERGERAASSVPTGPAELHGRAGTPCRGGRRASSRPTIQPAAFSPNVVGCACCSSVRPMIGVSRCALGELARRRRPRRAGRASSGAERALGDEHRRGVDGVLAGRAVVHRRVGRGLQRLDHRARGVADLGRARADRGDVVAVGVADARRSRSACSRGDHARARLRARERGLEVEQRLQPRAAGDLLGDAAAREDAGEDVRRLKKTVSRSPWTWTSKR